MLDLLYDYCYKWKLNVNLLKSQVMVCNRTGRVPLGEVWFIGDQCLESCDEYTYLGMNFTQGGITNRALSVLIGQAKKSLNILNVQMDDIGTFPPPVGLRLFHVCIAPILLYASEVWGYMEARTHQVILNKQCKTLLGVKASTSTAAVLGELGQFPLIITRKVNMIKYWHKIINGPHERLRYKCYQFLKTLVDTPTRGHFRNWTAEIRKIFIETGRHDLWISENTTMTMDSLAQMIKSKLIDVYIQSWNGDLLQDKLRSYRLYKTVFSCEPYLMELSPAVRRSFTRLRLSSHCLQVEMGRYPPRVPAARRLCRQCDISDVEDEFHFVLRCRRHQALRAAHIPRHYWARPNMLTFIDLMSSDDPVIRRKLGLYVHQAMQNREQ